MKLGSSDINLMASIPEERDNFYRFMDAYFGEIEG